MDIERDTEIAAERASDRQCEEYWADGVEDARTDLQKVVDSYEKDVGAWLRDDAEILTIGGDEHHIRSSAFMAWLVVLSQNEDKPHSEEIVAAEIGRLVLESVRAHGSAME